MKKTPPEIGRKAERASVPVTMYESPRCPQNGEKAGPGNRETSKKKPKTHRTGDQARRKEPLGIYWQAGFVLLAVAFVTAVRVRLLNFPLERDEGEYAYAGQLILQGIPPYQLAYNMKLPGTYYAYAGILAMFGQTPAGVHLGLLCANLAAMLLVFFLTKKLFGAIAGVVACASYGLMALSPAVLGFAGHATHFVILPALAGLLLLLEAIRTKKLWQYYGSGVLLGLGFLAKQPGAFLVLFAGLYLIKREWTHLIEIRNLATRCGAFALGAASPFALICLILSRAGVFGKFWFWTFSYARQYGAIVSLSDGFKNLSRTFPHVMSLNAGIWILAAIGIVALFWSRKLRIHAWFVVGLLVSSFLAVSVGFYYRPHYFVLMLPAVAILAGLGVSSMTETLRKEIGVRFLKYVPAFLFFAALADSIYVQETYLFSVDPVRACRLLYGLDPFPEALVVADYIKSHSPEGARVAVMGSEPEIYFYSHRHSATGYIYMYALFEDQRYSQTMQDEMIKEIESAEPEFVVVTDGPPNFWGITPGSDQKIIDWGHTYVDPRYDLVGAVDVYNESKYYWGDDANSAALESPINLMVYKKKL